MTFTYRAVNFTFKRIMRILCRVDDSQWHKFPAKGPLIMAVNHINFVEMPLMHPHLIPRPMTGFVKADGWHNPFLRFVFDLWGAIPLQRGTADMTAVRAGLSALDEGKILVIAPEGTRTGDGHLQQGHPGIVTMALKANVPILPVVFFGHEQFWPNVYRLRRTDFDINVGRPFYLDRGEIRVTKEVRRQMVDEIMYQLALLLPEKNRGYYADLSKATEEYLQF
jgi:1-acyl-sn-glycerol-3-phosphate acyltransferase